MNKFKIIEGDKVISGPQMTNDTCNTCDHMILFFLPRIMVLSKADPLIYWVQTVKNPSAMRKNWVQSQGWEDPLRRKWLPTAVFWPGEFHGQRSLAGYSPWGHRELDMSERLSLT